MENKITIVEKLLTCLTKSWVFNNIGWVGILIMLSTDIFSNITFDGGSKICCNATKTYKENWEEKMDVQWPNRITERLFVFVRLLACGWMLVGGWVCVMTFLPLPFFFWLGHNDTPKLVFEALYKCKICETYQFKCGKMLANRMCQWLSLQAIPREQICTQWKNTIRSRNWKHKLIINKYITSHITTWTHMYNKKINKKTSTYEKTEFRLIKGGLALIGWMYMPYPKAIYAILAHMGLVA
jgi:hypothetical protein